MEKPSDQSASIDQLKKAAASAAVAQLQNGMIVGLGSGTTATLAVEAIGERVAQGLSITGIPTSEQTADQARKLGISLATLGDHAEIDVTIDGADEVELGTLNLIKGGGGNLLREKIVASASFQLLIVVDDRKIVEQLGTQAQVPVEVAQFGWQSTARTLTKMHLKPNLRMHSEGQPFITDGGNYILDCACGPISSSAELGQALDAVVGVVEHGLFLGRTSQVFIGTGEQVKHLNREHPSTPS